MNKAVRVLSILKWACFPLGWIMYMVTKPAVGDFWCIVLAAAATVSFWMIVRKEEARQFSRSIASVIQEAIRDYNGAYNAVEVRKIRDGAVARVYVMGDREIMEPQLNNMKKTVSAALERAGLGRRIWVLQLTTISGQDDIPDKRDLLNKQLMKEMAAIQRRREQSRDTDKGEK